MSASNISVCSHANLLSHNALAGKRLEAFITLISRQTFSNSSEVSITFKVIKVQNPCTISSRVELCLILRLILHQLKACLHDCSIKQWRRQLPAKSPSTSQSLPGLQSCLGNHYWQKPSLTRSSGVKGAGCRVTDKWNCDGALGIQCALKYLLLTVITRKAKSHVQCTTSVQDNMENKNSGYITDRF